MPTPETARPAEFACSTRDWPPSSGLAAAHGMGYCEGLEVRRTWSFWTGSAGWGLPPTPHVECFDSFDAAIACCDAWIEKLHTLDFEVDGLVLKVNNFDQRRLGDASKSSRWLIAYKFEKVRGYRAITGYQSPNRQGGHDHRGRSAAVRGRNDGQAHQLPRMPMTGSDERVCSPSATWSWWRKGRQDHPHIVRSSKKPNARPTPSRLVFPLAVPSVTRNWWKKVRQSLHPLSEP